MANSNEEQRQEMKGIKTWKLLLIATVAMILHAPLYSQSNKQLKSNITQFLFDHDNQISNKDYNRFDRLVSKLERKRERGNEDITFLRSLFYKTHHRMLFKYNSLASVDETISSGSYGCLSGTVLYALLLEYFDFNFEIIELPNHVFIKVNLEDQVVYLESTLPKEGFITSESKILMTNGDEMTTNVNWFQTIASSQAPRQIHESTPYKTIGLQELLALQHFNESVKMYNEKSYIESINHAVEAFFKYPTEKNRMLMQLVINKIRNHQNLKSDEKNQLLEVYKEQLSMLDPGKVYAQFTPTSE